MVSGTDKTKGQIRKAVFAGSFYPAEKELLKNDIGKYFDQTQLKVKNENIRAIIVPHAGYIYSGFTAAWGYRQMFINDYENNIYTNKNSLQFYLNNKYKHLVLIGPSHNYFFQGLKTCNYNCWQTPIGEVISKPAKVDSQVAIKNSVFSDEHCLEVQLPFLQVLYKEFSITAFLTGTGIDYSRAADYFNGNYPDSLFIISSDLSHYLPLDQAEQKDKETIKAILDLNSGYFHKNENTACGSEGIITIMEMAKINKWKPELINYDTSFTASGDLSGVVGYASIVFVK